MANIDYEKIKNELEQERCPIHDRTPTVEYEKDAFNFKACCPEFREHLVTKTGVLLKEEVHRFITNALKGKTK